MGLLLFPLSILLAAALIPLGVGYGLIKCFIHYHIGTGLSNANNKLFFLAAELDKYGNICLGELLNDVLIKTGSPYPFGKTHQTISTVLGNNLFYGYVNRWGQLLADLLSVLDCHHCFKAIGIYDMPYLSRWKRIKNLFIHFYYSIYPIHF